jgi:hypothetical protein
VLFDVEDN